MQLDAFDLVDHRHLSNVLQVYNFPQEFVNMFQLLYSNIEAIVQVNGHLLEPFPIKRGVKQGDALSEASLYWR